MSDNTMPERLWAQRNQDDDTSVEYNAWHTHDDKFTETEYIRADVVQAQLDAANARIAELEADNKALLTLLITGSKLYNDEKSAHEMSSDLYGWCALTRHHLDKRAR